MTALLKLYSVQFKIRWRAFFQAMTLFNKGKLNFKALFMIFAIIVAGAEIIGGYAYIIYKVFVLSPAPEIIISLSFLFSQIITLIFGLFFILGMLFFAKDSEFLASLPVEPWKVFSSKLLLVYTNEIMVTLAFAIPPILIYGIGTGSGIIFYLKALLITLFLPMIPLAISSLLSLLMMNFVSRTKHRDAIVMILSFALILGIVAGQNLLTRYMTSAGFLESAEELLRRSDGIMRIIGRAFPPSIWASIGATSETDALANTALFILASIAAFVLITIISSKIYYAGALSHLETVKRSSSKKNSKINFTQSSPTMAIFALEWKTIIRSTTYALNTLIPVVMGPVMIALMLHTYEGQVGVVEQVMPLLETDKYILVIYGLALAGILFAGMTPASATTISREGKTFWLFKAMPVSPKVQVRSKLLADLSISYLAVFTTIGTAAFIFKMPILIVFQSLVLALVATFAINCANVIIDLIRPKLKWDTEQEAVKQNMNVVLGMGAMLLILLILGGASFLLLKLKVAPLVNGIAVLILSIVIASALYQLLMKFAEKTFEQIEY